jgi:glyoxylase-like metal-dependent hydrolase (beta-lactamase superfamily II)
VASVVGHWGGGAVWRITSGEFPSNAYFCVANVPGGGILIDAGLDGAAIDEQMSAHGLRPHQVFCTHGHFDHIGSAAFFQKKYGCRVFLHKGDARTMKTGNFLLMALKIDTKIALPQVTFVEEQCAFDIDGHALKFRPTPGHTPGSCVIEFGSALFTGDTLYSRGVGLSNLPGEDAELLKQSIRGLWPSLTPATTIYPGHGNAADGETVRTQNLALQQFLNATST